MSLKICCKNIVKIVCTYHFLKKKKICGIDFWQWHCQNRKKKKLLQLVRGNAIAEVGGKNCGNGGKVIAENGREKEK